MILAYILELIGQLTYLLQHLNKIVFLLIQDMQLFLQLLFPFIFFTSSIRIAWLLRGVSIRNRNNFSRRIYKKWTELFYLKKDTQTRMIDMNDELRNY